MTQLWWMQPHMATAATIWSERWSKDLTAVRLTWTSTLTFSKICLPGPSLSNWSWWRMFQAKLSPSHLQPLTSVTWQHNTRLCVPLVDIRPSCRPICLSCPKWTDIQCSFLLLLAQWSGQLSCSWVVTLLWPHPSPMVDLCPAVYSTYLWHWWETHFLTFQNVPSFSRCTTLITSMSFRHCLVLLLMKDFEEKNTLLWRLKLLGPSISEKCPWDPVTP